MGYRAVGPVTIKVMVVANVVAWLLFSPTDDGRTDHIRQVIAEMISSTVVILFAVALLLSTRPRFLERFFGGLDKMYRQHREVSVVGFLLLVLHVVLVPWRLQPGGGVPAGLIAFVGLLILVVLSIGPRLRWTRRWVTIGYRSWKRTHRFMGIFFVFSCAHMFLVDPLVLTTLVPLVLVVAGFAVGIVSYVYNLFVARWVRPSGTYVVDGVNRLTETAVEVVLHPRRRPLRFTPGQFVFVQFRQRGLREAHPFTVAGASPEEGLVLVIKASGDFTRRLHEQLEVGRKVRVEGAYGMLDYRRGKAEQVWIAGGIGITPFLSWLRAWDDSERQVDFFYAVRTVDDSLFVDEIVELVADRPEIAFHLNVSSRDGTLTPKRVEEAVRGPLDAKSVYMCGPLSMIQSHERAYRDVGVGAEGIHYEEFSFR